MGRIIAQGSVAFKPARPVPIARAVSCFISLSPDKASPGQIGQPQDGFSDRFWRLRKTAKA
jgi:hypothetical protein